MSMQTQRGFVVGYQSISMTLRILSISLVLTIPNFTILFWAKITSYAKVGIKEANEKRHNQVSWVICSPKHRGPK